FSCSGYGPVRARRSFPTRRSSDLPRAAGCLKRPYFRPRLKGGPGGLRGRLDAATNEHPNKTSHSRTPQSHAEELAGHVLLECEVDRKSTRLNSSHVSISYAVFCLK